MQEIISYFIQNPTALYVAVGLLSLCIGSFLNVVIYRTPKMMEQEWHHECQMLLHPEQPIIDEPHHRHAQNVNLLFAGIKIFP